MSRILNVGPRPKVYVELWFGRHVRTIGGYTYIDDLVSIAGGNPIFAERRTGYFIPDLAEVERLRPDLFLLFSELEYPVVSKELMSERGWDRSLKPKVQDALDEFLLPLIILPFHGKSMVSRYEEIRALLESKSKTIGPLDILIAAHALSPDLTFISNNIRKFARIPNLKCGNWMRKL